MKNFMALTSGLIFSLGLGLSGMMDPKKVQGFLDISRNWDPSLAFVMGGALTITLISFRFILKRSNPICDQGFSLPKTNVITKRLVVGSALFGIGWGLAGLCPGPALANLLSGNIMIISFIILMILSMVITEKLID